MLSMTYEYYPASPIWYTIYRISEAGDCVAISTSCGERSLQLGLEFGQDLIVGHVGFGITV